MTNGVSIAIPLGFLLLAAVLCWYVAHTKGRWPLKLFLTGFLALYSLETWQALGSYAGWPAAERMPQRALLLSATVREPNPSKGDPGAIFLWVIPLNMDDPDPFSYTPVSGEPRAYRIPYSRSMHEQAAAASKAISQDGRPMLIERDGLQGGGAEGEGGGDGNGTTYGEDDGGGFRIRELPPPNLPPKDAAHGH